MSVTQGEYLRPTWFVDSDHPAIAEFAQRTAGAGGDTERALRLFYAIRDGVRYTAYGIALDRDSFRASNTLAQGARLVRHQVVPLGGNRAPRLAFRADWATPMCAITSPRGA